ncbi:unnamed protein product (macronuclear) [Paramecium tetraurelia]|uniref:Uncharacterized protein n=1 Tax=Paramecium tetraurelia TaxID=5888 RepID=A0DKJ6_PARTE|nr:uncharacterized protein GSPATT00017893001 [Paramecium tetraurelia]CAK83563.1 unnamed protein product [Paramecium tetraurelia]|eukprot:XP_001450960.1 hypothetical protein (macronuclear) [Paramecium tetraurelia strain d4-2]
MQGNIKEAFLKLDHFYTSSQKGRTKYLILFTYEHSITTPALLLRVYEGRTIWILQILEKHIEEMRSKSEIKGTLNSFLDMMLQALESNQYQLTLENLNLQILFEFQLTQGVFIKSVLDLGEGFVIESKDSIEFSKDFTIDLYESMRYKFIALKNQKESEIALVKQQTIASKDKDVPKVFQQLSEVKEEPPKKRVVNGDIVMPNKKKRKAIGARFE